MDEIQQILDILRQDQIHLIPGSYIESTKVIQSVISAIRIRRNIHCSIFPAIPGHRCLCPASCRDITLGRCQLNKLRYSTE